MLKFLSGLASAILVAGCNPFAESLKENVANQAIHNRTLSKAEMIMKSVRSWRDAHGGVLPSPIQFRAEIHPTLPPENGFNITADELRSSYDAFVWTFPGGPPPSQGADSREVGHLDDPYGGAIALATGEVKLGYPTKSR